MPARAAALALAVSAAAVAAVLVARRAAGAPLPLAGDGPGGAWSSSVTGALGEVVAALDDAGAQLLGAVPAPVLDAVLPVYYGAESAVMGGGLRMSPAGVAALVREEGVGPGSVAGQYHVPYRDQAGLWTIGYGHLIKPWESFERITEGEALALKAADLRDAENAVNGAVTVPLTQPMFDALVMLVFNIGAGAFRQSTLLRLLNAGDVEGARQQFHVWNKIADPATGALVVSAGLVARRGREAEIFSGGVA